MKRIIISVPQGRQHDHRDHRAEMPMSSSPGYGTPKSHAPSSPRSHAPSSPRSHAPSSPRGGSSASSNYPPTSPSTRSRSSRRWSSQASSPSSSSGAQYFKFPPSSSMTPSSTFQSDMSRRRSASDLLAEDERETLTTCTGTDIETQATYLSRPSSPARGLAFLASRRNSSANVSNEDLAPLQNFQNTSRGQQRRTSNFLELPVVGHSRPRVCSLPEKSYNPRGSGDELYRLRTFSITNKGVVNYGDSIINRRSRSNTSVNSTASRHSNHSNASPFDGSCCGSVNNISTRTGSMDDVSKYRVVLLGESGVGKTALVSQFMTSEYMNTYDASLDDEFGEKSVSILLDGEESEMVFIDHPATEMSVENSLSTYEPHACVVVYSVVNRPSFKIAEEILNYLWRENFTQDKSVILVGNKADLARARQITSNEGKHLATSRDCKFIETSSGIQHNVDELLVGILKQIRLRELRERKRQKQSRLNGSRTSLSLSIAKEILHKMCLIDNKSKSCENLHVL